MIKNIRFIIILVCIHLVLAGFVYVTQDESKGSAPVITFDQSLVEMSVEDNETVMLAGVYANDAEDGDISSQVFIYDLSSFDENQMRTVTYAVFDSDDQMVTASRQVAYTDYTAPRFSSTRPLMNLSLMEEENATAFMSATSCVDGNITNRISLTRTEQDNQIVYNYTVTDSTGTTSTLTIKDALSLMNVINTTIDIELSDYIVYLEVGQDIDPEDYIVSVNTSLGEKDELIPEIEIETNFVPNTPGTYEVRYVLNRSNGDYGASKMIIVVEDSYEHE